MNKTTDKFCPHCGHHLYEQGIPQDPGSWWMWCEECQTFYSRDEALTIDEARMLDAWIERHAD